MLYAVTVYSGRTPALGGRSVVVHRTCTAVDGAGIAAALYTHAHSMTQAAAEVDAAAHKAQAVSSVVRLLGHWATAQEEVRVAPRRRDYEL